MENLDNLLISRYPGAGFIYAVNADVASAVLSEGDVVFPTPTVATRPDGRQLPVSRAAIEGLVGVAGVVAPGQSAIPLGAQFILQICGPHPAVKVDGTEETLTNGSFLGQSKTAGYAAPMPYGPGVFAFYVDANYTGNTVKKFCLLLNTLGLKPAF